MSTLVSIRDLHKVYFRGNERIDVLQGVTLDIPEGDFLALMGPSGSGKTTLLNLMGGLDTPTEGSIQVGGDRIDKLSGSKLSSWRARHIGFVFQMYNLLPVLTAARNVELPLLLTRLGSADRKRRVQVALNVVGLGERANHYPRQLSGGQEQRVGIARAIVTDPTLLLCDEPTGDLDRKSGDEILELLHHAQPRARQDHRHGDARSPRGGAGQAHAAPREGAARAGGGRMKFLPLVLRNLLRRKVRTIFTILSIVVAFVLFGVLMAIRAAFSMGVDIAGADRLMVIHRVSIIQPLPQSYGPKIRAVPGVTDMTHANWFGGYYQDPSNFMANMAVDPESWLRMYPEFQMPEEQKKAWFANRTGAIVGIDTAKKFGWKVGDHVPLISPIYRKPDGSPWDFTIDGIYDSSSKGVDKTQFFFHYDYMNETLRAAKVGFADIIGWYIFKVEDPATADQLAKRVDAMFENSSAETKTATEKAFTSEWAKQVGDIGSIMIAITAVVMGFILFVAGNAMAQSIRERTNELGVLKTLGFQRRQRS